ncbi:M48 family metalloprotease [Salinisphaera sp. Q1T1-3]|uniref:M48 family metalloprotease n=1 Tax=Salinisphaera sp. Q1T1-3 TaxID=2321229 RepID=UPI0011C35222|nr:M48 family metalloprotease [Salinisphaera sp. Q1T1-3]
MLFLVLAGFAWFFGESAAAPFDSRFAGGLRHVQHIAAAVVAVSAGLWLVLGLGVLGLGHRRARRARHSTSDLIATARWARTRLSAALAATACALAVTLTATAIWIDIAIGLNDPTDGDLPLLHHAGVMAFGVIVLFVAIDLFGFITGARAWRRALAEAPALRIAGRLLPESDAPVLWQNVRAMADRQAARVPDQIVIGFTHGSFATAVPLRLEPDIGTVRGQTLYLSLLALAHLDTNECNALLAHELSHIAHDELEPAITLAQEQARITEGYTMLVKAGGQARLDGMLTWPVVLLAHSVMAALDRAVAERRRAEEYRADRLAAEATSATSAAAALIRSTACQAVAQRAIEAFQERMFENERPQKPFALADAWLATHAMPAPAHDAASTTPHDRHPDMDARLAALGLDADRMRAQRATRTIAPDESALARYIGRTAPIVEQLDSDMHNLLTDDYARWLHTLIRDRARLPIDNVYYEDMRGLIIVIAGFATMSLLAGILIPILTVIDEPVPILSMLGTGVFGLGLAAWRLGNAAPLAVEVTETELVSPRLRDPVPIDALDHIGFDRRGQLLSVYLQLDPEAPLPRRRRRAFNKACVDPEHHRLLLHFGPLRTRTGRIDHARFAERLTAALQGQAASATLETLDASDRAVDTTSTERPVESDRAPPALKATTEARAREGGSTGNSHDG